MPEDAKFDLMGILINQFEEIDLREDRGLRGKPRRWFRALAPRRWVMTAVFIRCICGREHRVCSPKTCRCGAELSYRHEDGMITPYATIQTDTIEEWVTQGHPVESHTPELLSFDWKLVRSVNWPTVMRRMGK